MYWIKIEVTLTYSVYHCRFLVKRLSLDLFAGTYNIVRMKYITNYVHSKHIHRIVESLDLSEKLDPL